MGDRCGVLMVTRREDYERLAMQEYFESEEGETLVELEESEANYAYCNELVEWAAKGAIFVGNHNEGGSYPAGVFASDGENYAENNAIDGAPVVSIDDLTGAPHQESLTAARYYVLVHRNACKKLGVCACCHRLPGECYRAAKNSQTTPETATVKGGERDGC